MRGGDVTRKQQFLQRRAKYTEKMLKVMKQRGSTVFVRIDLPRRKKGHRFLGAGSKQTPKRISSRTDSAQPPNLSSFPPNVVITGGGKGNPPHQHVNPAWTAPGVPGAAGLRARPTWGGHQRRRRYIDKNPDRMNGLERQIYFADLTFYLNGFFPDWDPLQRTPVGVRGTHPLLPPWQRAWP